MEMYFPSTLGIGTDFETSIIQVLDKNPLVFDNNTNASILVGFKFFDVKTVTISEESLDGKIVGQRENYSPMFYFGKRLKKEDIKNLSISSWLIPIMEKENSDFAIFCDCGYIISNPEEGSITLEEYKKLNISNKNCRQMRLKKSN